MEIKNIKNICDMLDLTLSLNSNKTYYIKKGNNIIVSLEPEYNQYFIQNGFIICLNNKEQYELLSKLYKESLKY